MKDTATTSCSSLASCFYLYSLNAITTETVTPKSNNQILTLSDGFSGLQVQTVIEKAVTSERNCTYSQNCKPEPTMYKWHPVVLSETNKHTCVNRIYSFQNEKFCKN
jgi:hypothetical protein